MPIGALIGLASAAYQAYKSNEQKVKASKLQPSNYIPPAVQEAEANARLDANATAGPGYIRGLDKINRSTANYLKASSRIGGSPVLLQQAAADADVREKEMTKDLLINNEQYRQQRRQDLNELLMRKGSYEKEARDDFNATKSALIGAADQNMYNAVTNGLESVVGTLPENAIAGKNPYAKDPNGVGGIDDVDDLGGVMSKYLGKGLTNRLLKKYGYGESESTGAGSYQITPSPSTMYQTPQLSQRLNQTNIGQFRQLSPRELQILRQRGYY